MNGLRIVAGNANPDLARKVAELVVEKFNTRYVEFIDEVLRERRGAPLEGVRDPLKFEDVWCEAKVKYFPDNEVYAHVERTVRGQCVFVIQPTCPPRQGTPPGEPGPKTVNDHLMELLLLIDALKRASAEKICAVVPYFGYARQDRKTEGRVPISARLVANLIERAGATRVLAVELHASQIQGFFDIPLDHLRTDHLFARHIRAHHPDWLEDLVVVSPDLGGLFRARRVAERLQSPGFATLAKRRFDGGKLEVLLVIGDVKGKRVLLVDDDDMVLDSLHAWIGAIGVEGQRCRSGAEALEQLTTGSFPVMVTDLMLPDMNGIELMDRARAIQRDIEVVILTSYGSVESAIEAIRAGAAEAIMYNHLGYVAEASGDNVFIIRVQNIFKTHFTDKIFNVSVFDRNHLPCLIFKVIEFHWFIIKQIIINNAFISIFGTKRSFG